MVSPAAFFSVTADSPMSAGRQKSTGAQQSSPARVSAGSILTRLSVKPSKCHLTPSMYL